MDMHLKNTVLEVVNSVVISQRQDYSRCMERLQAYKLELMPNGEQERSMHRFAGACRYIYNKALGIQNENRKAGKKFINKNRVNAWPMPSVV